MSWLDHFVAELVAALFTWGLLLGGAAAALVLVYLVGVRHGRRDALESVDAMCAGFEAQLEETVPMLTRQGGDR